MPDETKSHRNIVEGAALTLREAAGLLAQGTHRSTTAALRNYWKNNLLLVVHRPPGCTNLRLRFGPREAIRMDLILGMPRSIVGSFTH